MYPHHQETLDALTAQLKPNPEIIALVLGGSVAKGWAKPESDVDVMIVKTDEAYQRHLAKSELTYYDESVVTYAGGYIDGKLIDKHFLQDVLLHGSEVAKSAFMKAQVIFSHDPEVTDLIYQIPQYPEAERPDKIRAFVSQVMLWNWYVWQAEVHNDRYLMTQSVGELTLFGSRLILAHNRLLYPYHKWLRRQLMTAPELPENYFALMDALLENPSKATADAYTTAVLEFQDWKLPVPEAVVQFMEDREWNWRNGKPTIHDW